MIPVRSGAALLVLAWASPAAAQISPTTDRDGDGVDDTIDVCCTTPRGILVDAQGRPLGDRDGDCDVDLQDYRLFREPFPGLGAFAVFQNNFTGARPPDGPCVCDPPLEPTSDGTDLPPGGIPDLIISEINPGDYIEVFNTTDQPLDLSASPYWWCAPFQYAPVARAVVVPAGGYATLPWPAVLTNPTDTDGELILYRAPVFDVSENILDFVCWGNPATSRRNQAEAVGKWFGDCAPSLSQGAIHRRQGRSGVTASSYDTDAPPSPQNCAP